MSQMVNRIRKFNLIITKTKNGKQENKEAEEMCTWSLNISSYVGEVLLINKHCNIFRWALI